MTNVKDYMFWFIMILALIFFLRSLGPSGPEHLPVGERDLGDELFTDPVQDHSEDPIF